MNSMTLSFSFEIEILFIVPYLFVMLSTRKEWMQLKLDLPD